MDCNVSLSSLLLFLLWPVLALNVSCGIKTREKTDSTGSSPYATIDHRAALSAKEELLLAIDETQKQQLAVQKDLTNLFDPWKNLVEKNHSPMDNQELLKGLKESFLKTKDSLLVLSEFIEKVRSKGELYFDQLEKDAMKLIDVQKQSDRYRKIMKNRRKFRLLYLSMKEAGIKAGHLYKNWRNNLQEFATSAAPLSKTSQQTKMFIIGLNEVEEKIRQFQKQSEIFSKDFGEQSSRRRK